MFNQNLQSLLNNPNIIVGRRRQPLNIERASKYGVMPQYQYPQQQQPIQTKQRPMTKRELKKQREEKEINNLNELEEITDEIIEDKPTITQLRKKFKEIIEIIEEED